MAAATLGTFTQDELEYICQTTLLKGELDWQDRDATAQGRSLKAGRREGRKEGLTQGRKEGRSEASLDIARKMKAMGLPISQIAEGTGLSTETVNQL